MLNTELFAAFLLATAVLILMPGPIVTLVIANSLAHGRRAGLATVAGASGGTALLVAAGALGLSTVLAVAADIFEWVRWAGVAYLLYLGLREWRAVVRAIAEPDALPMRSARRLFAQGALVAVTNPKTILFYVAFFPQFLDTSLAAWPQLLAMSIAFLFIATLFDSLYALLAARLGVIVAGARRSRLRHGITGTLLIGTGIGLALVRRDP